MKGKRTGIDFSKHEVRIKQADGFLEHYLRKPNTVTDAIRYINTGGILAVTGDYGNWIFCREFHPSQEGYVESSYWTEKLRIASTQEPYEFDYETTESRIKEQLNGGLEEYGWEGEKLEEMKEYMQECLDNLSDGEQAYVAYAYQNYPSFTDHECVVHVKKLKYWLTVVYDGFDEICRRLKAGEIPELQKEK
jgi:hypothetical protein